MSENSNGTQKRKKRIMFIALMAIIFGIVTIFSGGKSLFTEAGRIAAGDYVPFVLWFNFIAGFAYILAGSGLARSRKWSWRAALFIGVATSLVFALFGIHIITGGAFEIRTVFAMLIRSGFWLFVARFSYLRIEKVSIST
jgi:hypothetical protein